MIIKRNKNELISALLWGGWVGLLSLSLLFYTSACGLRHSSTTSQDSLYNNQGKDLVERLLVDRSDLFSKVLAHQKSSNYQTDKYEIQIIYTQINRDKNNVPSFQQFNYHLDDSNYFYPASLVKLPCSALALEKINELDINGLDKYSRMQTDSAWECQKTVKKDTSSKNKVPSVAHYIKKILLVSDNDAYGRVYEFLGQEYIHKKLAEKGYSSIRIIHRFDAECMGESNSYTNPVSFYDSNDNLLYKQDLQYNPIKYEPPIGNIFKGKGHVDKNNKLVLRPKDFTYYNYLNLEDIHEIIKSIVFPNNVSPKNRFNLTNEDYAFLYKYMSIYPRESDDPIYPEKEYKDSYKKYFFYGTYNGKITEDTLRIFNIVGQSFGYLSDCAYICDFKNKIEFMLSAVIYVNSDGIINDGKYEYDSIGFPFLADLGKVIYDYERNRKKEFLPELSDFKRALK